MTQVEYDLEMNKLRVERNAEHRKIDERILANAERVEDLKKQRKEIDRMLDECSTEYKVIVSDKKEIGRRYEEKLTRLRELRNRSIIKNKELHPQVAYKLHSAVEKALRSALCSYEDIDTRRIKCNYDYDDEGHITFDVIIPKAGDTSNG